MYGECLSVMYVCVACVMHVRGVCPFAMLCLERRPAVSLEPLSIDTTANSPQCQKCQFRHKLIKEEQSNRNTGEITKILSKN